MHFSYPEENKADESLPASAATIGTAKTFGMACNSSSASFLAARQTSALGRTLLKFFCVARGGSAEPARLLDSIVDVCMVKRTQKVAGLYDQEAARKAEGECRYQQCLVWPVWSDSCRRTQLLIAAHVPSGSASPVFGIIPPQPERLMGLLPRIKPPSFNSVRHRCRRRQRTGSSRTGCPV